MKIPPVFLIALVIVGSLGVLSAILLFVLEQPKSTTTSTTTTPTTTTTAAPKQKPLEHNDDAGDEDVARELIDMSGSNPQSECVHASLETPRTYRGAPASIIDPNNGKHKIRGDNLASDFICKQQGHKTYPIGVIKSNLGPLRAIDVTTVLHNIKNSIPGNKAWSQLNLGDMQNFNEPNVTGLCSSTENRLKIHPLHNPIVTCKVNKNECTVRTPFQVVSWNVRPKTGRTTVHTSYTDRFYPRDMCIRAENTGDENSRRLYFWRCTRFANAIIETILKNPDYETSNGLKVSDIDVYVADNIDRAWNHKIAELQESSKAAGIAGGAYIRIKYNMNDPLPVICHELAHIGAGGHDTPLFEYTQYKLQFLAHAFRLDGKIGPDILSLNSGKARINMTSSPVGEPTQPVAPCGYRGSDGKGYFCW
jgi:hypothetical protein